ncbi:MAG: fumarylacetoacetate hydrolase family protein [Desulfobacterales bacterium]|nr:fumarylacetoacetate hydrolase family protein [Desulfobacterales bacterium]
MKIAQYLDETGIHLGRVEDHRLFPMDFDGDMVSYLENGAGTLTCRIPVALDGVTLAAPVTRPSKIIAVGLNYKDHVVENKVETPETPLLFAKFPTSVTGPGSPVQWSASVTRKVDYEAELAVVIKKKIYNCPEDKALEAVFGYMCANDVSARDLQFGDGQWVRGKSLDTFCPLGPWIVTADEIPDPQQLKITCRLNGRLMQQGHTGSMIFKVSRLISFISRHITLLAGDVILTGTPSGVGAFRKPSIYMQDGDEVTVEIEKIGRLTNICRVV